ALPDRSSRRRHGRTVSVAYSPPIGAARPQRLVIAPVLLRVARHDGSAARPGRARSREALTGFAWVKGLRHAAADRRTAQGPLLWMQPAPGRGAEQGGHGGGVPQVQGRAAHPAAGVTTAGRGAVGPLRGPAELRDLPGPGAGAKIHADDRARG